MNVSIHSKNFSFKNHHVFPERDKLQPFIRSFKFGVSALKPFPVRPCHMAHACTTPQIPKRAIWHFTYKSIITNKKCLFSLFLLAYCILTNRVRVEAQFKPTFRGGVHMNLLRNCELKFVCEVLKWRRFLIQIARKKSSLASLLNRGLKEIIPSQNLTFLFRQLTRRICQISILAIRKVAKKTNKSGTTILVQLL